MNTTSRFALTHSQLCLKATLPLLTALLAAPLVLLIGLPLTGQTLHPVWTVQDTREVTQVAGPVTAVVSPQGEVFIAGSSSWYDWSTPANAIGDLSSNPLFVSKLDFSGRPLYSTAIGGASRQGMLLDHAGGLYVHGLAIASAFVTTPGAYRTINASSNEHDFVCKLRASDGVILFCALFDTGHFVRAFAVDSAGFIYFAGRPITRLAPTPGAFAFGSRAMDITKIDAAASTMLWRAEFSGTGQDDAPSSLSIDAQGNIWIAGTAYSSDFPITQDALVSVFPKPLGFISPRTGFLAKLNSSGTSLLYATFTGSLEVLKSMSLDGFGNIYVLSLRDGVPLVRKFSSSGKALLYEHPLAGIDEFGAEAEADELGFVTAFGYTKSVNFATYRSGQSCSLTEFAAGMSDGVLVRIGPGGELLESTFLGLMAPVSVESGTLFAQASKAYAIVRSELGQEFTAASSVIRPVHLELLQITPDVGAGDGLKLACLGSAATLTSAPLVRGEIISLFGNGLGPKSPAVGQPGTNNRFPTTLSGTQVSFDGVPAPILYASDTQINAIVPWDLSGSAGTKVCVSFQAIRSNCILAGWTLAAPGMFQLASGHAAVVNQDGTINSPENPAGVGSTVYVYATGLGPISPVPADGSVLQFSLPVQSLPVEVIFTRGLAERKAEVLHAGPAPFAVAGLSQIDVKIPSLFSGGPGSAQGWNVTVVVNLPGNFRVASPSLPISLAP